MKRHRTDAPSLVFGLIFTGIAAWWLLDRYVEVNVPHLDWLAPVALIAVGLIGIVASLRGGRGRGVDPGAEQTDGFDR